MATPKNLIPVPKPEPGSFDKNRPVSDLIKAQMEHLTYAVSKQLEEEINGIKTEAEAGNFIRRVNSVLRTLARSSKGSEA